MKKEQQFYDELTRRIDFLLANPDRDNEALRHDLLIYPLITSPFGLNWDSTDLISQSNIKVPKEVKQSHIFRGAIPKIRKPDLLVCSNDILRNVAVVEEKGKQKDLAHLLRHRIQLAEYQSLYEVTWGVLTDGEKWILKRGFETLEEFNSISELQRGMKDFQNCIGKEETLKRFKKTGFIDLIIISPLKIKYSGYENIPVIVCGVKNGEITADGSGYEEFENLRAGLVEFPDLHPQINSARFTWAMKKNKKEKIAKLRFETWKANEIYST